MLYEPGKEYLMEARLLPLARAAGYADVDSYLPRIFSDHLERQRALDALTINETSWFRDNTPYQAFTDVILPELLKARAATRQISIWSAACSSGQEAYSLAMLLDQHLPGGWTARITATDVSTEMVARVTAGRYSQVEMNRGLPATQLIKHFTRVGAQWEISPRLRDMVQARTMNLAAPFPPLPRFDLVLLRNVLIYFDLDTKRDILRRVHAVTAPDGYLMLGTAETGLEAEQHWGRESVGRMQLLRPAPSATRIPPAVPATTLTGA
ncbi:protein-glutamate O-methyltransferase CheR [Nocardioides dubius]|uniref:Protein-glutamate O-methyltransferase CheR n=2 Tax=Nocardioides dubius TaxID=317019 RepID=A0ABP4EEG3_9ACTN